MHYGHQDQSKEDGMVRVMRRKKTIAQVVIEKILCDNPRRLLRTLTIMRRRLGPIQSENIKIKDLTAIFPASNALTESSLSPFLVP